MGRLMFVRKDQSWTSCGSNYLHCAQQKPVAFTLPCAALGTNLVSLVVEPMEAMNEVVCEWPGCPSEALISVFIVGRNRQHNGNSRRMLRLAGWSPRSQVAITETFAGTAAIGTPEAEPTPLHRWERMNPGMEEIAICMDVLCLGSYVYEIYQGAEEDLGPLSFFTCGISGVFAISPVASTPSSTPCGLPPWVDDELGE